MKERISNGRREKGVGKDGKVFSRSAQFSHKGARDGPWTSNQIRFVVRSEQFDSCTINLYQDLTILIIGDLRDTHRAVIRSVRVSCCNNFKKNNHIT